MKTVVIGSDHAGFAIKAQLVPRLREAGYEVLDAGPESALSVDYPVYARKVCETVLERGAMGVLICGTGLGMSMAANRLPGIRAALCLNEYMARMTRLHNDANVLCLGERVMGPGLAEAVVSVFLETGFEGGRHQRRIDLIEAAR